VVEHTLVLGYKPQVEVVHRQQVAHHSQPQVVFEVVEIPTALLHLQGYLALVDPTQMLAQKAYYIQLLTKQNSFSYDSPIKQQSQKHLS
jgi:hypothetical protein